MALRAAMHQVGGVLLEQLLNADGGGYRGPRTDCGQGHPAGFVDYRRKAILTVLAPSMSSGPTTTVPHAPRG